MPNVVVRIDVDSEQFRQKRQEIEPRLESALNKVVDDVLEYIHKVYDYSASSDPPIPTGTKYSRTFRMKNARRKQRERRDLPLITGAWEVDELGAPYARYVIGTKREQARVHRNRWKSKTDVTREAAEAAEQIVENRLNEISIRII